MYASTPSPPLPLSPLLSLLACALEASQRFVVYVCYAANASFERWLNHGFDRRSKFTRVEFEGCAVDNQGLRR